MQPVEVEARWDSQGIPRPRVIRLGGERLSVTGTGRRWQDDAGDHMLCQVADGRIFEIVYHSQTGAWFLGFHPPDRKAA
jgi:hypothetical protein